METAKKLFHRLQFAEWPKEYVHAIAVTASEGMLLSVLADDKSSQATKKKRIETAMASTIVNHSEVFTTAVKKQLRPSVHTHAMAMALRSEG